MKERLQKIIAERGYCSRRKAEELILARRVKVNGEIITKLGYKTFCDSQIEIDDKLIIAEKKVYYLLNKPKGIISSAKDEKGRKCVVDLIECPYRIYPFGRLDYDSSGLLILSNDGELMNKIIHPSLKVEKVYEVTINTIFDNEIINQIEKGIHIESYITSPCKIKVKKINNKQKTSLLEMKMYEGKNREIRKIMANYDAKVLKLHRIKEANIELGNLKSGEYRELNDKEIEKLKKYLNRIND